MLAKLRTAKLLLKLKKCEFHQEETHFLRFIVRKYEIRMDLIKVKIVLT